MTGNETKLTNQITVCCVVPQALSLLPLLPLSVLSPFHAGRGRAWSQPFHAGRGRAWSQPFHAGRGRAWSQPFHAGRGRAWSQPFHAGRGRAWSHPFHAGRGRAWSQPFHAGRGRAWSQARPSTLRGWSYSLTQLPLPLALLCGSTVLMSLSDKLIYSTISCIYRLYGCMYYFIVWLL